MARNSLKNLVNLIEAEKGTLSMEQSFLNDLKRSIEITEEQNARKPSQTYKPSGMNCIRRSYYEVTGKERDEFNRSCNLIQICNTGTDTHVRIQTAVSQMNKNGMDCEWIDVAEFVKSRKLNDLEIKSQDGMETKLYHKKLNLSFMCDGIIRYRGKYYILEIKTEGSNKFWNRTDVDTTHYNQATAYSIAFNLNDIIFVYISRDTLDMKVYMFTPTDDMKQNMIGYIENCNSYIKKFKVPPKPVDVDKKTCSYCEYKQQCRSDG